MTPVRPSRYTDHFFHTALLQGALLLVVLLPCALPATVSAQGFGEFIVRVNTAPVDRRQFMVDSMLATLPAAPYIESDTMVWFFYRGVGQDVALAGDMNSWSDGHSPLQQLSTTTLWYRSERYAPDARLDYKYVVDGSWILDPRNPYTISGGFGPNSELRMPGYEPPPEILRQDGVPRGTLFDTTFTSVALGGSREVTIYLPPGYEQSQELCPVVLFHDGPDYLSLGSAANVLDNLIHEGRIPPTIGVFVPAVDRNQEYAGSKIDVFTDFIVNTVMSTVDTRYRTRRDPSARAMIGSSNGGNISLYIAMKHPDVFGNSAAQSSNIISTISNTFENGPLLPLRLFLDLGKYDIPVLIPLVHGFVPVLQSKGYDFRYQEYNEGHSWGNWRAHIDDALEYFFGRLLHSASQPPASQGFECGAPWPNPATGNVSVPFVLPRAAYLHVSLHDGLGREVRTLYTGHMESGVNTLTLSLSDVAPGVYILRGYGEIGTTARTILVR